MKLMHLSDLHLGKKLSNYSLLEDQEYILRQILAVTDKECPDCVLIAGDVYDKSVPAAEAVPVFDRFLSALAERGLPGFIISGNHDSAERLSFGAQIMKRSSIHIAPVYDGTVEPVTLSDDLGEVHFYMLPFIRPATVRHLFPDEEVNDYTDAVRLAVRQMNADPAARNVILAHQFVGSAKIYKSEEIYAGGQENVSAEVFKDFDYTALGHLHRPQNVGSPRIRYCGTPLKYSVSECDHEKSVTIVELREKDTLPVITEIPLTPLHDMQVITDSFERLMAGSGSEDYVSVTLTDDSTIPEAMPRLRTRYPRMLDFGYAFEQIRNRTGAAEEVPAERKSPFELFAGFFAMQNGREMDEEQRAIIEQLIEQIWEEHV